MSEDEEPGKGDPSMFAKLRPAFASNGTITATNASSINDNAAALVLCLGEMSPRPVECADSLSMIECLCSPHGLWFAEGESRDARWLLHFFRGAVSTWAVWLRVRLWARIVRRLGMLGARVTSGGGSWQSRGDR